MSKILRGTAFAALAAAAALALSGCDLADSVGKAEPASSPTAAGSAQPTPTGSTGARPTPSRPTGKGNGTVPDVCTLLTRAEVTALTGKQITQIDEDGAEPTATTRYCQWQLAGGQLAVMISRSTRAQFDTQPPGATKVAGVGEAAYRHSGHLYVFQGNLQVDVYATSGGSDAANLKAETETVKMVLPRI